MLVNKSGSQLTIEASPSVKDTFLHLGVGLVFVVSGLWLLAGNAPRLIALLFTGVGVLALGSFVVQSKQTQLTYVFDQSTQQLYISGGRTIPFGAIQVSVQEDTWSGTYGERHSEHSVSLIAGRNGTFKLPANSEAEADNIVEQIQHHLNADSTGNEM